jgi:hypothetical protein
VQLIAEGAAMALVLSLRAGQDFYVDDERVIVERVHGHSRFDLVVASSGKRCRVTDAEAAEIMEDVFVSAGDRPQAGFARVAIDAPADVLILRGERYRGDEKPEPLPAETKVTFKRGSQR